MNFNEALQVLRRINVHHGNAPISDAQAQCFYEELSRSVSFDEANAAVREFYALHPHGEWMTVGDINLAVRRKRRQSMPSEATITRLMEENQISDPDEMWQFRRSLLKSLGRGRPATQAVQRALELSRHPMLGGPRDGATKSLPQTRPGETPIHAIRPRSRPSSKASSADSRLGRIGRNSPPDIARTSNQKNAIRKNRLEKKQMADITTQTIRDTFLDNLPENVTREEGEEFWNAWLDRQREGHEPDMPTPPVGFQYAPGEVDEFDYGEPDLEDEQLTEDQKRDMLGLVHDYAMNTSELARTMLDCQHFDDPQVRELVRQTFKDLECAGSHVSDALKLMGWTADDATVG